MKDKQINWYTLTFKKPQQNAKHFQSIIDHVNFLHQTFPMMYSYKENETDVKTKYQMVKPRLSEIKFMINPKDKRLEIWIPIDCTDDEPLEM